MRQPIQLSDQDLEQYRNDGYLVVPDLLTEAEVSAFAAYADCPEQMARFGILAHRQDLHWARLATHPNTAGIAQQILGGMPRIVQTMYMRKNPAAAGADLGAPGVALHQDTHHLPNDPNTLMACWIAMSDTDAENGGLCVVPGSHRDGLRASRPNESVEHATWQLDHSMRDRDGRTWTEHFYSFQIDGVDRKDTVELIIPRGSGVFFTSLTIHGSYANRSANRTRRAFAVHFVRDGTWVSRCDVQDTTAVTAFSALAQ